MLVHQTVSDQCLKLFVPGKHEIFAFIQSVFVIEKCCETGRNTCERRRCREREREIKKIKTGLMRQRLYEKKRN